MKVNMPYLFIIYENVLNKKFTDESIRQTVGYALKGISQCEKPDLYLGNIIPLVFFAIHKKETSNLHEYNSQLSFVNTILLTLRQRSTFNCFKP